MRKIRVALLCGSINFFKAIGMIRLLSILARHILSGFILNRSGCYVGQCFDGKEVKIQWRVRSCVVARKGNVYALVVLINFVSFGSFPYSCHLVFLASLSKDR